MQLVSILNTNSVAGAITPAQQAAAEAAEHAYETSGLAHAPATLFSAAVIRDPQRAETVTGQFMQLYRAGVGSTRTAAMFALAGVERGWDPATVGGAVAVAYRAASGSAVASAAKAITSVDLGVPIAQVNAYRGQVGIEGVAGAILTDAGLRHHLAASDVATATRSVGTMQALAGAISVGVSLDTGNDLQQLAADVRDTAAEMHVTENAAALIVAAAALSHTELVAARSDYAHMNGYFRGSDTDAATVFAAYLMGADHGPTPLYLYSSELGEN